MVKLLSIRHKDLSINKFHPNWAQQEFLDVATDQLTDTGRIRIIVLKARQLGLSTLTTALGFSLAFTFDGYRVTEIGHEVDASRNFLKMADLYWQTYPFRRLYTPKYNSRNDKEWIETGSSIAVATAGNKGAGRSSTVHFLHASEFAHWPEPEPVFLGLRQTVPNTNGTAIVIESTANGVGNLFHKMWQEAEAGESEYVPLFFPWHKHPEYMASAMNLPYQNIKHLDEEERTLRNMGLSDDRLAWRRWAIINLCNNDLMQFHQEYPTTPEEAFVSSGTNVFPYQKLQAVYEPMEGYRGYLVTEGTNRVSFRQDPQGPLTVFKLPTADQDWGQYFVAGDPTRTTRGDHAVAQVLNRRTLEQVAEWRGRIDPGSFAEELYRLGLFYNTAGLSTEIEGPGQLTIGKLLGLNYPYLYRRGKVDRTPGKITDFHGWSTTMQTKQLMIGWMLKVIMDQSVVIHSKTLFNEARDYVTLDNGGYGPATERGFDDCVMSYAQAIACIMFEPPIEAYGMAVNSDESEEILPSNLPWNRWDDETEE